MTQGVYPVKYSVIVCNQRGKFLHWALKGIQWQTLGDFETIVVDYGMDPPFGTMTAPLAKGPQPLRILRWEDSEWNHPRARNIGIANARGERIVIVNSDCLMAPTLLEEAGWLLDQDPHRQIYWQRFDLSEEGLQALRSFDRPRELFGDGDNWHGRGWGDFHSLSTYGDFLMVERDVVMEYGGFDERASGWGVYDHDLACRLDRHGYPSFWAEGLRLVHLWHPQRPGLDASWRRNIDALSPDFLAERDVRNQGRATFERYVVEG